MYSTKQWLEQIEAVDYLKNFSLAFEINPLEMLPVTWGEFKLELKFSLD